MSTELDQQSTSGNRTWYVDTEIEIHSCLVFIDHAQWVIELDFTIELGELEHRGDNVTLLSSSISIDRARSRLSSSVVNSLLIEWKWENMERQKWPAFKLKKSKITPYSPCVVRLLIFSIALIYYNIIIIIPFCCADIGDLQFLVGWAFMDFFLWWGTQK